MAAYRRVYDSTQLQSDCQEPGSAPYPTLGDRVWATFIFILKIDYIYIDYSINRCSHSRQCSSGRIVTTGWVQSSISDVALLRKLR